MVGEDHREPLKGLGGARSKHSSKYRGRVLLTQLNASRMFPVAVFVLKEMNL